MMCGGSPFLLADTNFPPSPPFSVFDDTTFCLRVGTSLTRAVWDVCGGESEMQSMWIISVEQNVVSENMDIPKTY